MPSKDASLKRTRHKACGHCRKKKRKCVESEFDPRTCAQCHEDKIECLQSDSKTTPPTGPKPATKIEDTLNKESIKNPKALQTKLAQPATFNRTLSPERRKNISSDACGICLNKHISSGEKRGDKTMLKCGIDSCSKWYHLSCVQFRSDGNQKFQSLKTRTKESIFFCMDCFDPNRTDLVNAVARAESDFKMAMERIQQVITAEKKGWPKLLTPSLPQEDATVTTDFEPAKEEKYQGFQVEIVESLLASIEQAVYNYDQEITYTNDLVLDGREVLKHNPLKVWDQIDPHWDSMSGKEWFNVDGTMDNLSESHLPITAALRRMLKTYDDKPLQIGPDLHDLNFSQVHIALINWFIFDILNDKLNIYSLPAMRPLRATHAAVASFGDARWKGNGKDVLREVKLRAWHKTQYREEVIEKVGWQGELIRRLEGFLAPMTKKIGHIHPRSESRANIIKYTLDLWSYLDVAQGTLDMIDPTIGEAFDAMTCENVDDELNPRKSENMKVDMKVKWVQQRGFRFEEVCRKATQTKARVFVE